MKRLALLALCTLVGGAFTANAPPAAAAEISLQSRTYLPVRGIDGEGTHALLYEYLNFNAEDLSVPGLYVRAGGWGRTDLADETYGKKTNGELQYAFLGWRAPVLNAEARVGRLALTAGVARHEVFDGLLFGSDLPGGFDVTMYGGVPVETEIGGRSNDSLYGGRISQGFARWYRIGASYLQEENDGSASREEAGADVFLAPLPLVEVTGSSLYNVLAEEWARHDYRLGLGPFFNTVRLGATWASTDYRYYFQSPVHPAFVRTEPEASEKLDRIGGELQLALGLGFTLSGSYTSYTYDVIGDAESYGAALDWVGAVTTLGAGYRNVRGSEAENKYQAYRAYASTPLGPVRLSAGVEHLIYEVEIVDRKTATTGTLGLRYAVSPALELSASGEYGQTPEFDREVKGLLAVLWRYDASYAKGGTK